MVNIFKIWIMMLIYSYSRIKQAILTKIFLFLKNLPFVNYKAIIIFTNDGGNSLLMAIFYPDYNFKKF